MEYRTLDGKCHWYTPDFVIRRKDGKCLIIEIKDAEFESAVKADLASWQQGQKVVHVEGRKAVALKQWEQLDPNRLKYQIIFAGSDTVPHEATAKARKFVERD